MRKLIAANGTMAVILLIFAGVSLFTSPLPAQEGRGNGRVVGFVHDTGKKPIAGVTLTLEYIKYSNKQTVTSNEKGKWTFVGLGVGDVRISVAKDGYKNEGIQFRVSGIRKNPNQYITLKKLSELKPTEVDDDKGLASKTSFKKAIDLYKEREFEAALALFRDFLAMQPQLYKVGINIANCYLEMGQYNEAIKEYEKVLAKITAENPDLAGNSDAAALYSSIGDTYMRQDKLKEAEEYFKKSIEIDPSDHALAYNVAEILFAAGKTDDAIKYYDIAVKIKPGWSKAYLQRGYAYLNKGDIKKALQSMEKFLELAPNSPEAEGVKEVIKSLK